MASMSIAGSELVLDTGVEAQASPAIQVGVSSWSDRSLTHESSWYPRRSMKAAERIAFYASRFSLVEIETTYRFPPTPDIARQWVERTPPGFRFDIQAWSLLTGQPTMPASLWEDLVTEVRPDRREHPKLYMHHLSAAGQDECWARLRHALAPLADSGKLGTLVLRFPRWFVPRDRNRDVLQATRERLGDLPAAVELHCPDWFAPEECEYTLSLLDELNFAFVCVDSATDDPRGLDGLAATSSSLGVMRLCGRRPWEDTWSQDWRSYRYGEEELKQLAGRIAHLASCTDNFHVLVGTCWRDDAMINAERLLEHLNRES